jgi:hypothetical protein
MLATWLVELYLSKINQLEDFTSSAMSTTDLISTQASTVPDYKQQQEDIEDEFKTFLETYKGHLHKPTTYKLIASHGRSSAMLYYADLIGDYDRVISHWIIEQDWAKALEVLGKQVRQGGNSRYLASRSYSFRCCRPILMYFTNILLL